MNFFFLFLLFNEMNENKILRSELSFIRSEFRGQLPKLYKHSIDATRRKDHHFNDQNREEIDRYVCFIFFSLI